MTSVSMARDGPGRETKLTHAVAPGHHHHPVPPSVPGSHHCNDGYLRPAHSSEPSARAEPSPGTLRTATREPSLKHHRLHQEHGGSGNHGASSSMSGRSGRWSHSTPMTSGRSEVSHDTSARPHSHGSASQKQLEAKGVLPLRGTGSTTSTGGNGRRRAGGQGSASGGQRRHVNNAESSRLAEQRAERLERAEKAAAAANVHDGGSTSGSALAQAAHRNPR